MSIVITGAGSGIGEATAQLFSEKGHRIFLLGRSSEKLERVQSALPGTSEVVTCDLSDPSSVAAAAAKILAASPTIDLLVNNAGIYFMKELAATTEEDWFLMFQTNFFAATQLTRLLWPALRGGSDASVVNISSTLGIRTTENTGAYSASKAAMNSWTQTLAIEGAKVGVRVNAVCPGIIDTPIHNFHNANTPEKKMQRDFIQGVQPLNRIGQPSEIAEAIWYLHQAKWSTGTLLTLDGGISLV